MRVIAGLALAAALAVPGEARAVDTSRPDRWVGTGTPRSCTSRAVVRAVAKGGVIRFRCGPDPVRIEMKRTAKVVNTSRRVVLDGRGLVTLSGGGKRRILYQNTCDQRLVWTTSHCNDQATPKLVLRNLTFTRGNSTGSVEEGGGGGAVFVDGGTSTFEQSRFCDVPGAAILGRSTGTLTNTLFASGDSALSVDDGPKRLLGAPHRQTVHLPAWSAATFSSL